MPLSKKYLFSLELRQLARYGMVISHPARVVVLRTLRREGVVSYQHLLRMLPLESSTVSDHLRILERAQLIETAHLPGEIAGYRLIDPVYEEAKEMLRDCLDTREG